MKISYTVFFFFLVLISIAPLRGHPHQIAITFDDLPSIEDFSAREQQEINSCILEALKPSIGFVNEGRLFGKNWDRPRSEKYSAGETAEEQAAIKQTYLAFTRAMLALSRDATLKIFGRPIKQIWLLHVPRLNALVINELIALAKGFEFEFISLDEALTDAAYSTPDTYYAKLAPFQCAPAWLYRWDLAAKRVDWTSEPQTKTFGVDTAIAGCCGVRS